MVEVGSELTTIMSLIYPQDDDNAFFYLSVNPAHEFSPLIGIGILLFHAYPFDLQPISSIACW